MALPEKDWYTLDEIAHRWGCSVDDLWHYAETEILRFSVVYPLPLHIEWKNAPPDFLGPNRSGQYTASPIGVTHVQLIRKFGLRGCNLLPVLPPAMDDSLEDVHGFINWRNPSSPKFSQYRDASSYFEGPIIAREERDRFEKLHRIGAHAGAMPTAKEMLDARERTTLLRMLAVLIAQAKLPEQPHKAAGVLASMAARHGIALPTDKTCAEKIAQARKASRG